MHLVGQYENVTKRGETLKLQWNNTKTKCSTIGYVPTWLPDSWSSTIARPKLKIFEHRTIQYRYTELEIRWNQCGGQIVIDGGFLMKAPGDDTDWIPW